MTPRERLLTALLKEAIKIIHCHARNIDADWLKRARAALRPSADANAT
jgi:hypothetical protein